MKITSKEKNSNHPLTWDKVIATEQGQELHAIRRITIDIHAGDCAIMNVETYGIDESDKLNTTVMTNKAGPVTTVRQYFLDKISVEARSIEDIKKGIAEVDKQEITEELRSKRTTDINPINELEV